ncbi:MAG: glycosyltransferase family 4 protein [Thermoplasmata archaeon]|nr:glycosyltransferase family 4 protein [Thermoplasmata archaeon]
MTPRNLLVITNNFPDEGSSYIGGIFVKEQLRYLAQDFDRVTVISPSMFITGAVRGFVHKDYSYGNVDVHFLRYLNVPFFYRYGRKVWIFMQYRAVDRFIRKRGIKFDLIHAHCTWASGTVGAALKRKHKVPLIVTEHTSVAIKHAIDTKDPVFKDAWDMSDAIIRVRGGDIERFASIGVPIQKVHHIPNGFDGGKFHPMDQAECRRSLDLPLDKKIVMNVGNLVGVKGQKYLIAAMKKIAEKDKSVICVIVGGGKLNGVLHKQIEDSGLSDTVLMVGGKPHSDIACWMNACDMLVHSSLSESGPVVMFEAMACGRPYVGTRVGSVPEVVTSDDYGLVCAPGDPSALSGIILKALDVDWSAEKIIAHARKFDWSETVKPLLSIYDELLARKT